eukprot:14241-Ditylum_brightwellii.AAC.1
MASLVTGVNTNSVQVAMEAAESNTGSGGEDISWIAFLSAIGSTSRTSFVIGTGNDRTSDGSTNSPHVIDLTPG